MKQAKLRIADLLVERGLSASRDQAERLILAGRVQVDGQPCTKPGTRVSAGAVLDVRSDEQYVSRGGIKMARAIEAFGLDVEGVVALDAGASVGGFTDCLLQHGASRVYAVDVGYGQIRGKLTADPRVVNMERTNISDVRRAQLQPPIALCTADLSYLSLATAVPILARLFEGPPAIVALVKPLFEGVSQDRKADLMDIEAATLALCDDLASQGLFVQALADSPILGTQGTVELLALVTDGGRAAGVEDQLARALARAATLAAAVVLICYRFLFFFPFFFFESLSLPPPALLPAGIRMLRRTTCTRRFR